MELIILLSIPVLGMVISFFPKREYLFLIISAINLGVAFKILNLVLKKDKVFALSNYLFADSLSTLLVMIITILSFLAGIYSIPYLRMEGIPEKQWIKYYFLLNAFIFSMLLASISNNFGILWVAIEATTLSTAFLVSFYRTSNALEAGWKYLILCSVGIAFALFGIVILFFSVAPYIGYESNALNWTKLMDAATAGKININLAKFAFAFILIGFGTKMGLAPMHTWLPDAHSQAPSPVSALLSGVLLNCAAASILRAGNILGAAGERELVSTLLVFFGALSVFLAGMFLLRQKDYKRMLAFSSMEHMGLITLSSGFGGIGIFAAMFHMLNHAFTKSLLFMSAGNILSSLHTREIGKIRGLFKTMPITAFLFGFGTLAITGTPPFSIFSSEFLIISSGFQTGHKVSILIAMVGLVMVFAGLGFHVTKMLFGEPEKEENKEVSSFQLLVPIFLLIAVLIGGVYLCHPVEKIFNDIQTNVLRFV
jgi:hydrogenase-4 component F